MHFKKSLRIRAAQAMIEYFLIFAVVILVSALSIRVFWPYIRDALQGEFFPKAAERLETADQR